MKFKNILSFALFLASMSSSFASAGGAGWGASGGELLGDTLNPWWVKNTTNVNFCVQIDSNGVSASADKINTLIDRAIAAWKTNFSRKLSFLDNSGNVDGNPNVYGVGTQNFTRISCNGTEDLKFQFGYGSMTAEQKRRIGDPKKYIGVAVRTSYDETLMKGKGFILLGSDQGVDKFQSDSGVADKVWSIDLALYVVIVHELGHVFGVPHVGQEFSLMSQQGPEFYVTPYVTSLLKNIAYDYTPQGDFFMPAFHSDSCKNTSTAQVIGQAMRDFFELPANANCYSFDLDETSKVITVSSAPNETSQKTVAGTITGGIFTGVGIPAITIKPSPQQKVLTLDPKNPFPFLLGPAFVDVDVTAATFRSASGNEKPIHIHSSAVNGDQIYGTVSGKIVQLY